MSFSQQRILSWLKMEASWAPVIHTWNPIYIGGRDQEDCGLKPAWINSSQEYTQHTQTHTHTQMQRTDSIGRAPA
jgi:hypothetical protein